MTDFTTIERVARELCEGRWGAGHWDGKGTRRSYWRRKARKLITAAHSSTVAAALYRACGWPV